MTYKFLSYSSFTDLLDIHCTQEVVYIVATKHQSTNMIKVGQSDQVLCRLTTLLSDHYADLELLALIQGNKQVEAKLHFEFAACHYKGEWFSDDGSIRSFIGANKRSYPLDWIYKQAYAAGIRNLYTYKMENKPKNKAGF